jgi:hypothetical protein
MLRIVAACCLLLVCASCVVPSLNTLCSPDKSAFEPALIGKWAEADSDVKYEFFQGEGDSYALSMTNVEGKEARFVCNLAKLGDNLFLDMYPTDLDTLYEAYAPWNFIPMHTFYLIKLQGNELVVKTLNPDWLMQLHTSQPQAIAVAGWQFESNDILPLLTASTPELQEFIANNVDTPDAFYGEMHLAQAQAGAGS